MIQVRSAEGSNQQPLWSRVAGGNLEGTHLAGITHAQSGEVRVWVDGLPAADGLASYDGPRSWSRLGGGLDGVLEGPNSRFAGALGAVLVLPGVADEDTIARVHAWARGRFGVP